MKSSYSIAIASDHAGYKLKSHIKGYLNESHVRFLDYGTNDEQRVDYPDFAILVCEAIIEGDQNYGILICGTGIGMSIAANRHSKIRAALCFNTYMAEKARQHNDANILVLGSNINNENESINIINKFISTKFEGGRHARRLEKIN